MKDSQALKIAELALEKAHGAMQSCMEHDEICEALNAVRQALEQPKQEPVAWCRSDTVVNWKGQILNVAYIFPSPKGLKNPIPLYTEPPKRKWIGLTDEENPQ